MKDCLKNEQLARKGSFEGNCEILRTIFQPRALSSSILASQEGVYLFYNPPIDFYNAHTLLWQREKKFSQGHSTFAAKQIQAG